ncbi:MFS transporter [Frigoribacterium faeni]|uniref:MFS family permease n=1 Tax=Frigoribacterium faeni TaxID=145483 RepID=A0A7W3PJ78_9MICO|nr:MFS transporter [Frigoribacterium faeni]MBA8813778.1 MFS family permease [Frigoribacterium faeni]BFF15085.1 MFS transporter [Microbacterium flavescens]GEK84319.1 MFS transporter [Frigoribacterium faeni]
MTDDRGGASSVPRRSHDRRGPLAHRPFRWLLAARTTSILGNAVAPIALAFAVLDLTGSAADLGLVVAARSVANVAVLLFGGVIADRLPRDVVLVGTSAAAAATQGVVAALVISGTATIPSLVVMSVLNGAVAAVSLPAAAALVPETVPVDLLRPANALLRLSVNGGSVVGASAGAGIVALVGPGWGLAVDAAGFALAGALFARLRLPRASGTESGAGSGSGADSGAARAGGTSVVADLREGWQEFTRRSWVWIVVAQFAVLNAAFVGATTVLGPVVADESFGRAGWGLVVAAQTVGLAIGAVIALRWRPRRGLAIGVGLMALTAVPVVTLGLAPVLPALIAAFALGGVALEIFAISWDQSLQSRIPREALARVYSYDMVGSFVAIPLGEVLVGPAAHAFGTGTTLLTCAAIIVVATAAALSTASVRRVSSHTGGPPAR